MRTLIILLLSSLVSTSGLVACSAQNDVAIRFSVAPVKGEIRDLRFYLHEIELLDASGAAHPLHLVESDTQSEQVALIDLRGAKDGFLRGRVQGNDFDGVRFTVGVPFALNHGSPLTASPPLNRQDLFWAWQSGYKFLRLDAVQEGKEWSFHLGSTGCSSQSALRPPLEPCAQPNRMRVELRGFDPLVQPIKINVAPLLAAMTTAVHRACTGDYTIPECAALYALTGLNVASGVCDKPVCESQQLFVAGKK
jgi:uncharacterized repeat protein (TIGR04052 family)